MNEQLLLSQCHIERHPEHAARIIQRMAMDHAVALFLALDEPHAARVARYARVSFMTRLLQRLATERAARLVHSVGVHAGVAILRQLGPARVSEIMNELPTPTQLIFQMLLSYPPDSVGAWMDNQAAALSENETVAQALKQLGDTPDELASQVYVLDEEQRLLGVVGMPQLLRSKERTPLRELWQPFEHRLSARSSLSAVSSHPGWYASSTLPVVDNHDRFTGVLHFSRVGTPSVAHGDVQDAEMLSDFMQTFWTTSTNVLQGAVAAILPRHDDANGEPDA